MMKDLFRESYNLKFSLQRSAALNASKVATVSRGRRIEGPSIGVAISWPKLALTRVSRTPDVVQSDRSKIIPTSQLFEACQKRQPAGQTRRWARGLLSGD